MNKNSTIWGYYEKIFYLMFFFVLFQNDLIGQINFVYANQVISHDHVDNESNAILNNNSFATLHSYGGVALGIGDYTGKLELGFPSTLPAGTTSYVRIDFDGDALNALLGGGLGTALADITGTLVLGNHYFKIKAKNNATPVLSGSSQTGFSNENLKLIVDKNGYYYLAITPNLAYNRIEIEDNTDALLLGTFNSMKVYYAFYTQGSDTCDLSFATSFDGTGGSLDVLGLGDSGVENPKNAIDDNPNSYSEISMGILSVAGTMSQTVYFSSLSNPSDQFHITLQLDEPSLLNLGLSDGIKIEAFNGENSVFVYDLGTLLDLDLLGLLNTNQKGTIHLSPGIAFNRVKVTISSLTQLNLVKDVKIYEITRSVGPPTIDVGSQNVEICKNQTATLSALTANTNELVWYANATDAVPLSVTAYNGTYTTAPLLTDTTIYVSARKIGCTIDSQRIPIHINVLDAVALTVEPAISGCGFVNLRDAIINFDASGDTTYNFFDASDNPITALEAANIQVNGIYYIQAQNVSQGCVSIKEPVNVTVNPIPQLDVSPLNYAVNIGDTVTLLSTSNAPTTWYNQNGVALASNIAGPFTQAGTYTFTAVASNGLCAKSLSVTVVVTDPAGGCPIALEKVFADTQSSDSIITGGVSNGNAAIDHDLQTHSTITTGLGLLGIGTTWQTLQWNTTVAAGTPIILKLGSEYSGLILAGAISIVGTKRDGGGNPVNIGNIQPLSGDILNLLSGENSFEYTFVPANNSGPQAYDGVRIIVGSILSVAQNAKVYEVYFNREANPIVCLPGDVEDIFSGVIDLGVGALTSTVDVANEWNAVDNTDTTYATMYNGVGVLAAAEMTIKFRTPSQADDILKVKISKPGTLLTVSLLSGFTIQCYMGNTPVGGLLDVNSSLLTVQINGGGTDVSLTTNSQMPVYDRVKIRFGGAVNVLDFLNINTVKRAAKIEVIDSGGDNIIEACSGSPISIAPLPCTTFIWYDSEFGGTIVTTGSTYTMPNNLAAGTYIFYIQPVRNGCEVLSRTQITVIIGTTAPAGAISTVLINSGTDTVFCNASGAVVLTAQLSGTPLLNNPIFHWYSFNGTNQVLIPGETSNTLNLTGLLPGTYTYYVGVSSDEYCETAQADRVQITFTILPFSVANDIIINDAQVCLNNNVVLQPSSLLTNPVYTWYFTNDSTQPITNGTFGGITYLINVNGTLTISGLTAVNSPYIYYVSLSSDTTCPNLDGTLQDVNVIINDTAPPTTSDTTQDFCLINNPTIANIQVVGTGIIWYDAASNGNVVLPTAALIDNTTYYASQTDAITGCESSVRLAVTIQINDTAPPTTSDTTQDFCLISNPTVANIQVVGTGIIWYDATSNGNVVLPTAALIDNMTYYASQTDAITGCESSVRLAVTIQINDTAPPTTSDTTQDFCLISNPTVANIQVVGTGIIWYDAASNGNVVLPTAALIDNMTYYASQTDAITGCESSVRLAVTIQINDTAPPTTSDTTQDFCLISNPTVANIQVVGTGIIWYDAASNGNVVLPTAALIDNTTYYASQTDAITGCESSVRLAVTIQINDTAPPTTSDTTQDFCLISNPTVANIQVVGTGIIWYDAASNGNVVLPTAALIDNMTYYASQTDVITGCESSVRLAVTIQINDTAPPTTSDTTQDFCLISNPTVANIQVVGTGIIWYDAASNGNVVLPTAALIDNTTYYASQTDAITGCESSIRLAVTIQINDTAPPTTNDTSQEFCTSANATLANIQVNQTGVIWYNLPTAGSILSPTTVLVSGTTYYAALIDPVTGCESSIRLAVAIQFYANIPAVITGGTPSTCINEPVTYTTNAGMTNYNWTLTSGGHLISGGTATDNSITVSWDHVGSELISISFTDTNGCTGSNATSNVTVNTCSNLSLTKTADNMTPFVGDNVVFTVTISNVGSTQFQNVTVDEQIQSGFQFVSAAATNGTYNATTGLWTIPVLNANEVAVLTITVKVLFAGIYDNVAAILTSDPEDPDDGNVAGISLSPMCLYVFNEFTPNEDGSNDFFNIKCAESYPNNTLDIFNRYGNLVYSTKGYKNNWKGIANVKGTFNGTELASGTYYYVFDTGDSKGVKTGWLQIMR